MSTSKINRSVAKAWEDRLHHCEEASGLFMEANRILEEQTLSYEEPVDSRSLWNLKDSLHVLGPDAIPRTSSVRVLLAHAKARAVWAEAEQKLAVANANFLSAVVETYGNGAVVELRENGFFLSLSYRNEPTEEVIPH